MPDFHRLEEGSYESNYDDFRNQEYVICSFETERFGYVQVRLKRIGESWKFESLSQEPSLNMFTKRDILEMRLFCRIIWRLVYDSPAMLDRFE